MTTTLPRSEPTSPVQALLERLHDRHAGNTAGEVASYIPELAAASPDWFGISLVTADGSIYEVGETRHEFTIQSISKPLTYALALEAMGEEDVRRHVDVEPSGEAFNSITLQPGTNIPLNPMVNAGAIATTSLIKPLGFKEPIDRIINEYSAFAGRDLAVDEAVFESENKTGHRNRAIAYLLKNANVLDDEVEDIVETYFRQCSTLVNGRDLAVIAATLASTGVNPITKERVLREDTVRSVLSVMASCGMYDAAGDWLYSVGLPAKSGVAGGIIAVLPGQLGIAVYSPPLDVHGNSVRGVKVCEELSEELHLHVMSPQRRPAPPIRSATTCANNHSKHLRPADEHVILRDHGTEVRVTELQGEILFAAGELITKAVLDDIEGVKLAVLDFTAVREIDPVVVPIISHLVDAFEEHGGEIVFSGMAGHPNFSETIEQLRDESGLPPIRTFRDLDLALEWCEDELIRHWGGNEEKVEIPISQHVATQDMDQEEIEKLSALLERREYPAGTRIYEQVGHVEEMLFVVKGNINVMVAGSDGMPHRLTTFSSGMTLGEVAMLSERVRLGYSDAADEVVAWAMTRTDLEALRVSEPALVCTLLENMMKLIALRVGQLSRDLAR
ncbi:MAG: glutaminase A [Thermoleophilia bacterium]|nr:glutaminase A [Thermoleophilia bacterium]